MNADEDGFWPGAVFQISDEHGIALNVAHNIFMVFEYLTVLIAIVVGLSVTSFLTNIVRIIHVRGGTSLVSYECDNTCTVDELSH